VRALIELAHDEAWEILVEYRDVLDSMVLELIEKETISQADMARLCARVQKRRPMAPYNGFGKRQPSDQPPVLTPAEKDALAATAEADGVLARAGANGDSSTDAHGEPRSHESVGATGSSGADGTSGDGTR
jgi:cell division protease FtsH